MARTGLKNCYHLNLVISSNAYGIIRDKGHYYNISNLIKTFELGDQFVYQYYNNDGIINAQCYSKLER